MTREAKIGLLMVVVMVGVFGFLVYKRVSRQAEIRAAAAAEQEIADGEEIVTDDQSVAQSEDDSQFLPREEKPGFVDEIKKVGHKVEEFAEEALEEVETVVRGSVRRETLPLPTDLDLEKDDSPQIERSRENIEHRRETRLPEISDDSFGRAPESLSPPRDVAASDEQEGVAVEEPTESDPFEDAAEAKAVRVEFVKPERRHVAAERLPEEVENRVENPRLERLTENREPEIRTETVEPDRRSKLKELERRIEERELDREEGTRELQPEETRETEVTIEEPVHKLQPVRRAEFPVHERRKAASISLPDDESPLESTPTRPETIDGESYTIQSNDNFWTISRKRYGAGRYYMALALHNQQIIPDPKRMKPGTVIATPEVEVLERLYGSSIPKAATDDSTDASTSAHSRAATEAESWGFFLSDEGEPMYRVGQRDTLTDIAKNHLRRVSRWVQIREMNRNVLRNGTELKIGTVLRLPADACRDRMAEPVNNLR